MFGWSRRARRLPDLHEGSGQRTRLGPARLVFTDEQGVTLNGSVKLPVLTWWSLSLPSFQRHRAVVSGLHCQYSGGRSWRNVQSPRVSDTQPTLKPGWGRRALATENGANVKGIGENFAKISIPVIASLHAYLHEMSGMEKTKPSHRTREYGHSHRLCLATMSYVDIQKYHSYRHSTDWAKAQYNAAARVSINIS